jgi:hypothetical protein
MSEQSRIRAALVTGSTDGIGEKSPAAWLSAAPEWSLLVAMPTKARGQSARSAHEKHSHRHPCAKALNQALRIEWSAQLTTRVSDRAATPQPIGPHGSG